VVHDAERRSPPEHFRKRVAYGSSVDVRVRLQEDVVTVDREQNRLVDDFPVAPRLTRGNSASISSGLNLMHPCVTVL
jgi:hypothetical protein